MYKLVVEGVKQIFEMDYHKALAQFFDFVEHTDRAVRLYSITNADGQKTEELLHVGYTADSGDKMYKDLIFER